MALPETESSLIGLIPDTIYNELPTILKDSCKLFTEKEERDVYLTAALSVLSGCLPNVLAYNNVDKKGVAPNLLSFVIAPPASGKGVIRYAKMLALEIKATFANNISMDKRRPHPKLIIPANISTSGIIELLKQNNGVGILIESEIDTLINAHKQEWGDYSDILRNSFENESVSLYRKTDKQYAEIERVKLSLVISGTENQFKALMKSAENGLFSRGCYYIFEDEKDHLICYGRLNTEQDIELHFLEYARLLNTYYIQLQQFEYIKVVFSNSQLSKIQAVLQAEFDSIYGFKEIEANIKRAFVITQKIASVLSCLYQCEKDIITREFNCLDSTLQTAIGIMVTYLRHAYRAFELLPKANTLGLTVNYQRIYLALTNEFQRADAIGLVEELGVSIKTIDNAIKIFKELRMVETLQYGKFKKLY